MPKIIVDITELANWEGEPTGVPRVMNELCIRFKRHKEMVKFARWDSDRNTLMEVTEKASLKVFNKVPNKIRGLFKNKIEKEVILQKNDTLLIMADWHSNDVGFVNYLLNNHKNGILIIQVVYDLLPIITPQYSGHGTEYVTRYSKAIYPLCASIIAISENTKKDIIGWLNANKLKVPPIEVIRLGDDFDNVKSLKPKDFNKTFMKDYILCVGTIEARKNHMLLYYVYKLAASKKIKLPNLIIVGRVGWHSEAIHEMLTKDPEIRDSIMIMENVNDNELSWLYENSLFSIYPSFYEGWGLPIAESIMRGKTCLSSITSSMPEVAGNLIEYFNPFSTEECLNAILKLARPEFLEKANSRIASYKTTSWDDTFMSVKAIIEKYAKQN